MGTIFNVLLYGIMIMQCYVYFQRFKQCVNVTQSLGRSPDMSLEIGGR